MSADEIGHNALPSTTTPSYITLMVNMSTWVPKYYNACRNISHEEKEILRQLHIIHLSFASLSVAGALSIIVYSIWRRSVRTSEVRPLFHLAVADVLLAVCWIIGAALWDQPMYTSLSSFKSCNILQAITEMFNVITFYLTTNYALNVYIRLKDRLHRSKGQQLLLSSTKMLFALKVVIVVSWLVPVLVMVPAITRYKDIDQSKPCLQCLILFFTPSVGGFPVREGKWLWNNYGAIYFVISLLASIFAILVFYLLSIRIAYWKLVKTNDKPRDQVRAVTVRVSCYILVFLFCWIPALTLAIMDLSQDVSVVDFSWLFFLQGMTAPSQGFLNCIVYGWTKKSFREAQNPNATTPMIKQTYRVYGTAEGQTRFPAKPSRSRTPPPSASSASEGSSNIAFGKGLERTASARWSRSSSVSDFSTTEQM